MQKTLYTSKLWKALMKSETKSLKEINMFE